MSDAWLAALESESKPAYRGELQPRISRGRDGTALRLRASIPVRIKDGDAVAEFTLRTGENASSIREEAREGTESAAAQFVPMILMKAKQFHQKQDRVVFLKFVLLTPFFDGSLKSPRRNPAAFCSCS